MMKSEVVAPNIHGGEQSKSETIGPCPMVATRVGKNCSNDSIAVNKVNATASHQTVQSVMASTSPDRGVLFIESFSMPHTSSTILSWASICSSIVSHEAGVVGKSGIKLRAIAATTQVRTPSMKKSHLILCFSKFIPTSITSVHLHAAQPCIPSMVPRIPDAMSGPTILLTALPQVKYTSLEPIS